MSAKDAIRQSIQECEAISSNLQTALQHVHQEMARQRLQSAVTNLEAVINDCRSAMDNV